MRRPRIKATGEGFYHVVSRFVGRRFLLDAQGDRPDISPIPPSHSPPLRDFGRGFPSIPFPLRKASFQPHPIPRKGVFPAPDAGVLAISFPLNTPPALGPAVPVRTYP